MECSLDPLAIVEVSDMRKETKVAKRTNAPKWDASFSFNVTNEAAFVEVRGCCSVIVALALLRHSAHRLIQRTLIGVAGAPLTPPD